ncbi:MAG: DNA polymerase III subunit gamma/tau [Spirochaetaceae bacterium]|nr:DNA polymerase III subunit gamma/tau [Spirochaetaceae bacterium]
MAYEVTATRRRPQRFDDLVGQEFVAATLKNSIQSEKIAHAYLFAGPRGCGKTSSARILAKALNCEKGPTATPCGECATCREITRGSSLDVIEIDGASNTSVNDIRQIKDEVLFPPNSCRYKIYIIDEVHMLSTSAFNALLKTIEEPPPYVIFIFATTELHKVPATIKSRCQQFHFRLVAVEQLKNLLAEASAEIGIQADDEALYWIAREATGSVRDAYTLFDQVASFSEGHITYDKIRDKLGLVGVDLLNELCEICVAGESACALEKLDTILQGGVSIEQFISNFTDYLRSLLLIKSGITKEALIGQSSERFSAKVLEAWNVQKIERGLSLLLNLYRDIRYSLSPRYEVDLAMSRLCGLSQYVSNQEVQLAVEQAKNLLMGSGSGNAPVVPVKENPRPVQNPAVPRFSVFSEQGENSRPFHNGGAVPPEHRQAQQTQQVRPAQPAPSQFQQRPPVQQSQGQVPPQRLVQSQPAEVNTPKVPLEELRNIIIQELTLTHAVVASSLMDSLEWDFSKQDKVIVPVQNAFAMTQLQKEKNMLSQLISKYSGQNRIFESVFIQQKKEPEINETIPQADILCKLFKGTVVGVKKNESI